MNLIFITYVNRSGSTFLANLFSKYSEILVCPEADILIYNFLINPNEQFIYNRKQQLQLLSILSNDKKLKYWGLQINDLIGLNTVKTNFDAFAEILKAYQRKVKPNATTIVFKGTKLIDLYDKISPEIKNKYNLKYISIIRDGRAVFASQKRTIDPFTYKVMITNPFLTAVIWNKFVYNSLKYENDKDFFIIKYEWLINDYKKEFSDLLIQLNLQINYSNNKGDLFSRIPENQKPIHLNILKNADKELIESWKKELSAVHTYLFEKKARTNLLNLGYDIVHPKENHLILFLAEIYYTLKLFCYKVMRKFRHNKLFLNIIIWGLKIVKRLLLQIAGIINEAVVYLTSLFYGLKYRKLFKNIETYCMFIGYARSGHSLIGSLLDAHENIIIAHELNVLKYISNGYNRNQIFYLLLKNSNKELTVRRRISSGYSYYVDNQWQGSYSKLRIIGDKKGGGSSQIIANNTKLLKKLKTTIGLKIKCIHIIRNPYDNISTIAKRKNSLTNVVSTDIQRAIDFYFSKVETVAKIKDEKSLDIIDIRHEDFIDDPKMYLNKICKFIGANPSTGYLNDCSNIIFKKSHKSRYDINWSAELIEIVKNRILKYSFLKGYSYES